MRVRQPEDGHHRVPDELLGASPQRRQLARHRLVEGLHHLAVPLRIEVRGELGGARQVGEQDRDELALLGGRLSRRRPAVRTEPRVLGNGRAAVPTDHALRIRGDADTSERPSGPSGFQIGTSTEFGVGVGEGWPLPIYKYWISCTVLPSGSWNVA